VVGAAAAGQSPGDSKPAAQYNLLDISGDAGAWAIRLTRRGLTGAAMPPSDLMSIDLTPEARLVERT
jgi:hypothetical protein